MMGADVVQNGARQQASAIRTNPQKLADVGGTCRFMHTLKQVHPRQLFSRQVEVVKLLQRDAGATYDNPFGKLKQAVRSPPATQIEKRICTYKDVETVFWRAIAAQL